METGLTTAVDLSDKDSIIRQIVWDAWGPFLPQQKLQSHALGQISPAPAPVPMLPPYG